MKKPPCIRGLSAFKKGCPQRCWNGEDGCPAWIEMEMKDRNGNRLMFKECLDLHMARMMYHNNCLLEGNQQSIETFRNNISYVAENGSSYPKPDQAVLKLVGLIEENMIESKRLQSLQVKEISV